MVCMFGQRETAVEARYRNRSLHFLIHILFLFIQLENLTCPLMFIVGEDDLSSASQENADLVVCAILFPLVFDTFSNNSQRAFFVFFLYFVGQIEENLRAAGKIHLFNRLSYPGAGHLIEPPYSPHRRSSMWSIKPRKRELCAAG